MPPVAPRADRYLNYKIHGEGISSLPAGLSHLVMVTARQQAAQSLAAEVLACNDGDDFVWYKTKSTPELACYWDGAPTNLLWITNSEVHVKADGPVVLLNRPTTWSKQEGEYVGWLLPGAEAGSGGGPKRTELPEVLCPATSLRQRAGIICPDCEIVHS